MPLLPFRLRLPFLTVLLLFSFHLLNAQESYDSSNSKFHISGEAGGAFFDTGPEGEFPNNEFRVDEAKLFVEAAISDDIYVFGEINVLTREEPDEHLEIGELYVQFENVSRLWNQERTLNVKAGRFDVPFGEEYLSRDAIDNPLISHTLSDLWGVDEGVEFYGTVSHVDYVFAIQNGSDPILHDYDPDKAFVGRLNYRANDALHFSFSAMRTGNIDVAKDRYTAEWFGNGFLRVIGSPATTTKFHANLLQGDGNLKWEGGHFHAAGGHLHYDDNDTTENNARNVRYFQLEAIQNIKSNRQQTLYGGIRFSRIVADEGFPVVGNGNFNQFLFDYSKLTNRIWRLAFGIGYRIGDHVVLKTEYNIERGTLANYAKRDKENFFGAEAAFKF